MNTLRNAEYEFVNMSDEAKEPSKEWANNKTGDSVPDEKHQNAMVGDGALFPGNFGMKDIGQNSGKGVRNDSVEPKQLIGIKNNTS